MIVVKSETNVEFAEANASSEEESSSSPSLAKPAPILPPGGSCQGSPVVPSSPTASMASPTGSHSQPVPQVGGPLLFQPFLPFQTMPRPSPTQNDLAAAGIVGSGRLPFSIDNILKPTFGDKETFAAAAAAAGSRLFNNPFLGMGLASSLFHHQQQNLLAVHAAAMAAAAPQSSSKENSFSSSPSSMTQPPPCSPAAPGCLAKKAKPAPAKPYTKVKQEPPPPSASPEKGTLPKEAIVSINKKTNEPVDLSKNAAAAAAASNNNNNNEENDGDVPPGMVRGPNGQLWPAWVFCTRYSDRPSSGPRSRKIKKSEKGPSDPSNSSAEKRPRTAFSSDQLSRLKREFEENRYLTEERRRNLADELGLNENQIKIWFQNKRAKIKKNTGQKGDLAQMLMAQGLYNHSTVPVDEDDNPIY